MRRLIPLLTGLVMVLNAYLLYRSSAFDIKTILTDSAVTAVVAAITIWAMLLIINAYPTQVIILTYAIATALVLSISSSFVDWLILKLMLADDNPQYEKWLSDTITIRYVVFGLIIGWVATYTAFKKQTESLKDKFKQQADASSLLREAELFKLRQQLQPHFLYNSLNSISALTMIEPAKAQEMIGKLSDFLRNSVKRESQQIMPIDDELEYIKAYLSIESVRFGDRLRVNFEREYINDAFIPPFLLQPLLENAIKFGLYGKTGEVTISVNIRFEAPNLIIHISNPYDSTGQPPKGTGFGLTGVKRRLYLLYARADLLETIQQNEIFTTILKIPQSHV